ncbi:hypothetical protein LEP1GSC172_2684 [Leptospira noguchii]|uniref:Uncharacterized protein n=2 Tax=Leptospira noguchii TaxID=28182 RepID=M6VJ76_9LEPT|nr:hypothetical protein LEP1GSC172_2684 [Leptospira noguchii]
MYLKVRKATKFVGTLTSPITTKLILYIKSTFNNGYEQNRNFFVVVSTFEMGWIQFFGKSKRWVGNVGWYLKVQYFFLKSKVFNQSIKGNVL